ncbi:MAG TPA: hypothetical protein VH370_18335 [Humisphaera sp.]|jgi:hypothetical protein|nr:hypothetical protein [Humisphaera sp.]
MKAIFIKELRECLRWAGIIFSVLLVIVLFRAWRTGPFYLFVLSQELTLIYAPLAGLAMGFAQSWFEIRADNWGFVVHRPVHRAAIFAAKCVAGLLLLYVSLAAACAIAVIWATRPGNLPVPFQARMVLPMTADVLIGGCYYFAGMVLTLRRARWMGTRILPLGAPFLCSVFVYLATHFWQAVIIIAAGQMVGALAAWSCFDTAGAADRRGAPAIGLGVMLYAGAWVVGCALVSFLGIFESDTRWQELRVDQHGNVLQVTKIRADGDLTYLVTDAAGKAVPEYDGIEMDDPANADLFVRFSVVLSDERHLAWPFSTMTGNGFRSARPGLLSLRTVARPGAAVSALPLFDRQDRFIKLYDPNTSLLVGSIGPNGFAAGQSRPADRFDADPLGPAYQASTRTIAFPSVIYWMELDNRQVRKVFAAPIGESIIGAHELPPATDPVILVATKRHMFLLKSTGEKLASISYDLDPERNEIEAAILPNHHLMLRAEALSSQFQMPTRFLEYSDDGTLLHDTSVVEHDEETGVKIARTASFGLIHPIAGLPLHRAWLADAVFELDTQHHGWLFLGCMLIASMLSAGATLVIGRRFGFASTKAVGWTITNLLIGPSGIVVLMGLNPMPAREICEACKRNRLAGHPLCPNCGAALVPPAVDGREIFEPAEAFQPALV